MTSWILIAMLVFIGTPSRDYTLIESWSRKRTALNITTLLFFWAVCHLLHDPVVKMTKIEFYSERFYQCSSVLQLIYLIHKKMYDLKQRLYN